jgi:hypothetical protein
MCESRVVERRHLHNTHPPPTPSTTKTQGTARARPILTSLPLQIALYFGGWWSAAFWLATAALFVFKGLTLPYPRGRFAAEFAFVWLWVLVEPARIFVGA